MKLSTAIITCVMSAISFTSCLKDDAEQTITYSYVRNLTFVTDSDTGSSNLGQGATYTLKYDISKSSVDIKVESLDYSSSMSRLGFEIKGVPFNTDSEGALVAKVPDYTVGGGLSRYHITDMVVSMRPVTFSNGSTTNYFSVDMTIDGRYRVHAVPQGGSFQPTTTVKASDGDETSSKTVLYSYVLDPNKKLAAFGIYNLNLGETLYTTIEFENLPFYVDEKGVFISAEENLKPKFTGTTGKELNVRNLSIELLNGHKYGLSLIANGFEVTAK